MNFIDATKNYFVKWSDFKTRSSRSEFWWGNLGAAIAGFLVGGLIGFFYGMLSVIFGWPLAILDVVLIPIQIYLLIASLALIARRLHDVDRSGWWFLIIFTLVGAIFLLYWYCKKSYEDDNKYGPNPLLESHSDMQSV